MMSSLYRLILGNFGKSKLISCMLLKTNSSSLGCEVKKKKKISRFKGRNWVMWDVRSRIMTWGCEAVRQAVPSTLFSAVPTVHTLYCFNWAQKYNWGGELGEKLDQRGAQAQTAASAGSGHRRLEEHIKLLLLLYQVCPCQLEDTGKAGDSAPDNSATASTSAQLHLSEHRQTMTSGE